MNPYYEYVKSNPNTFRDVSPIIGTYILNSTYDTFILEEMQTWILRHLLVHHNLICNFIGICGESKLKDFSYIITIKFNRIYRRFTTTYGSTRIRDTMHPNMPIEDFDSDKFPKVITRACIYLQYKIHKVHITLLNNIYSQGIAKDTSYYLDDVENHAFMLLPSSFQHILKDSVHTTPSVKYTRIIKPYAVGVLSIIIPMILTIILAVILTVVLE